MPHVAIAIGEKWPAVDLPRFARENEGQRAASLNYGQCLRRCGPRVLRAALVLARESERRGGAETAASDEGQQLARVSGSTPDLLAGGGPRPVSRGRSLLAPSQVVRGS